MVNDCMAMQTCLVEKYMLCDLMVDLASSKPKPLALARCASASALFPGLHLMVMLMARAELLLHSTQLEVAECR